MKVSENVVEPKKNGSTIFSVFALFAVFMFFCGVLAVLYVKHIENTQAAYKPESTFKPQVDNSEVSDSDNSAVLQEDIVSNMSLEEKVGQLFMVRSNGDSDVFEVIKQTRAGGVILFADDFKGKDSAQVVEMIDKMQASSDGKMLVAVDEEGGTVVRVSSNPKLRPSKFKSPRQLYSEGGLELIVSDTDEKCRLLESLHININMAPVADVCNQRSGFMYKRAFGGNADATAEYVSSVVSQMNKSSVASCVKHFPGYGNSKSDTHKGLDVNEKSLQELRECDLVPFQSAIDHGADAIMITHTVIKSVDPDCPASLSKNVVDMIRSEMGFDGVIVSDSLEMGAIIEYSGDSGKVCVMAVNAGVDILCIPKDPVEDYGAVLEAVNSGEISESRIDEAVKRIVKLKMRLGLYEQ